MVIFYFPIKAVDKHLSSSSGSSSSYFDMYGAPIANINKNTQLVIRLLIPNAASGTVLGRGGAVMKKMGEVTGSITTIHITGKL